MTKEEMNSLRYGDRIRNEGSGMTYVVIYMNTKKIVAVRSVEITNPSEWKLLKD